MYKLAAFDLDNTLVGRDLTLAPRVKAAVAAALARGVIVTIATGRGPSPTDQFAAELGLNAPLICFQGGIVYDSRGGRILHETRLDPAVVPFITRLAQESSGRTITANVVALGVLVGMTGVVSRQAIEKAVAARAPKGTEEMNRAALNAGFTAAELVSKKYTPMG